MGFVGDEENGEGPDDDCEQGEAGAGENERDASEEQADAAPNPDWENREGGKGKRKPRVKYDSDEVQGDREAEQDGGDERDDGPSTFLRHG